MAAKGEDDNEGGYRWMNEYEKTWEALQEDEDGSIQASIDEIVKKAKRKRLLVQKSNVRLGMMRHLIVILDMSKSMKEADLLRPSRLASATKLLENFITEFFDQNPISQIALFMTKNKCCEKITDLSGNPHHHISRLQKAMQNGCHGEPSLQNSLELAVATLKHVPSHASREVLIVFGSLTTCDPGDINKAIQDVKEKKICCSIVGLSAEIKVCKTITSETSGSYSVILDERHFNELLLQHIRPLEAKEDADTSLIRMGFPKHVSDATVSFCMCHINEDRTDKFNTVGFFCPQCHCKYCELPVECKICGLTLVSAPHLARSYQHLFPLPAFTESDSHAADQHFTCFGCQGECQEQSYSCPRCKELFCVDCDLFIHETLHTCPGCTGPIKQDDDVT